MTQGERVKELRSYLNLTLEKFGDRLGVTKTTISRIEKGERNLTDQMSKSICREFNVSEEWLKTGCGEMLLPSDRKSDIARLAMRLLDSESDTYKNRLISALANLTVEEWKVLANIAVKMTQGNDVPPVVDAAHERTDIDVTDDMRKHDDDIMHDDSEWE
ncbi:MAG: helix-turn-helix transcriptional regulator [Eubacteriales bacterium]|nr:helix-turn-helix transcriptional regulator [Eubacteriales bacterium]